jgi:ATP-dependent Clp protease, protease subunit
MIFVRGRLDDALANAAIAQLVLATQLSPDQSLDVFVDSPGGSLTAALSVYDLMQSLSARVSTTVTGAASGAAVLILAGGSVGSRFALPHARVQLADDEVGLGSARVDNPEVHAEEARRMTARWRSALLRHCSQTPERLSEDLLARRWLSATEALAYGLVDGIAHGGRR